MDDIAASLGKSLNKLSLSDKPIDKNIKIKKDNAMIKNFLTALECSDTDIMEALDKEVQIYEMDLENGGRNSNAAIRFTLSLNTRRDFYEVEKVTKVVNPFLYASYLLTKQIKRKCEHYNSVFHGTSKSNLKSIYTYNFDWRLAGSHRGHIFGRGVSFASRSTYACHYPRTPETYPKTVIMADILVENICYAGNGSMVLPPEGYDATAKPNGDVIVKYDDAEYIPRFIIYYLYK